MILSRKYLEYYSENLDDIIPEIFRRLSRKHLKHYPGNLQNIIPGNPANIIPEILKILSRKPGRKRM